jgi:hypothetical protein
MLPAYEMFLLQTIAADRTITSDYSESKPLMPLWVTLALGLVAGCTSLLAGTLG